MNLPRFSVTTTSTFSCTSWFINALSFACFLDSLSVASCIRICFTDIQFGFVRPFSSTSTMPCPYLVDFSWYVQTAVLKPKTSNRCFNVFCGFFLRRLRTFHGVTTFGRRSGVWQLGLKKMRFKSEKRAAMQLRYLYCFFITPAVSYRVAGIQALAQHLWNRFCVNSFWNGQHCGQLPALERWAWMISSMVFFVLDQTILRHWQLGGVRYAIMQCLHIVTSAGMWQIIKISYAWIFICLLFYTIGRICMVL